MNLIIIDEVVVIRNRVAVNNVWQLPLANCSSGQTEKGRFFDFFVIKKELCVLKIELPMANLHNLE